MARVRKLLVERNTRVLRDLGARRRLITKRVAFTPLNGVVVVENGCQRFGSLVDVAVTFRVTSTVAKGDPPLIIGRIPARYANDVALFELAVSTDGGATSLLFVFLATDGTIAVQVSDPDLTPTATTQVHFSYIAKQSCHD